MYYQSHAVETNNRIFQRKCDNVSSMSVRLINYYGAIINLSIVDKSVNKHENGTECNNGNGSYRFVPREEIVRSRIARTTSIEAESSSRCSEIARIQLIDYVLTFLSNRPENRLNDNQNGRKKRDIVCV